jgi:hypothetical protein
MGFMAQDAKTPEGMLEQAARLRREAAQLFAHADALERVLERRAAQRDENPATPGGGNHDPKAWG